MLTQTHVHTYTHIHTHLNTYVPYKQVHTVRRRDILPVETQLTHTQTDMICTHTHAHTNTHTTDYTNFHKGETIYSNEVGA